VVRYLQTRVGLSRIMIVDLDVHQGNGFERDFLLSENVYIVDCYSSQIFPQDSESKDDIARRLPLTRSTSNEEYLSLVDSIQEDIQFFSPQFVVYNADTDIMAEDSLGQLSMSSAMIVARDERVLGDMPSKGHPGGNAAERKVPARELRGNL
jgi:histone deacetylase 11